MTILNEADTWLYHLGDVNGRRADAIAATNADLVVTEWASYDGPETPYTAADLDRMRGDDGKLIVSYLSIGEAETYRYYWKSSWERKPPDWIDSTNPEWVDNIKVRYWDADWKAIVFDYLDRIIEAGFDGIYLDIVDAYEQFEETAPGERNYRAEMAAFVAEIRAYADGRLAEVDPGRAFYLIGQNALEMVRNDVYRDAIDGVAKEDIRYYYEYGSPGEFASTSEDDYDYSLGLLKRAEKAGKAAFSVEYVPAGEVDGARAGLRDTVKDLGKAGVPLYVAGNRDLDAIFDQPGAISAGPFPPLSEGSTPPPPTPDDGVTLRGDGGNEVLRGGPGDDLILGKGGDDRLLGRAGDDNIVGGGGEDTVIGGGGDDQLSGGSRSDVLRGGGGEDVLKGGGGLDNLFGGGRADRLLGGGDADFLKGGLGDDIIEGGKGADELFGDRGDDTLIGGRGGDVMEGGGGADLFVIRQGSGEDEITDFDQNADRIDLSDGATYEVFSVSNGTYLDLGRGDGLTLIGLDADQFDASVIV